MKMQKYSYQLETLSSLIISPRASLAFYDGVEFNVAVTNEKIENDPINKIIFGNNQEIKYKNEFIDLKKLKIIYPFYQYSTYEKYDPINANYYVPGSSIKGAIISNRDIHLMVDDIPLSNTQITLRNIYKVQYLKCRKDATISKTNETAGANQQENKPKSAIYEPFFDYIGIEMVKKGISLDGEFITDQNLSFLDTAEKATIEKLKNMKKYIEQILKLDHNCITAKIKNELEKVNKNLENLNKNGCTSNKEFLILIGGYKGLLLSIEKTIEKKDTLDDLVEENGGVYLDPETYLPYGLVKLKLTES